jgi:hypothetical protein
MKLAKVLIATASISLAGIANADWHTGTVTRLGVGYDGSTVILFVSGWSRSNCTCYPGWPDSMCLDRTRTSFKEEYASILRARATGQTIQVNIDEVTCKVIALYEMD